MTNAVTKLDHGRQRVLFAEITLGYAQLVDTGVAVPAIDLPYGARLLAAEVVVDTAFNAGTSIALAVGDSTNGSRYGSVANLNTTGRSALTPTGYVSTDGAAVTVTPTITGATPTAGSARLAIQYVIAGRADEVQPN